MVQDKYCLCKQRKLQRIGGKWIINKANCETFMEDSDRQLSQIREELNVEMLEYKIKQGCTKS